LAVLMFGCSKNPSEPTPSSSINLNSPTGGYTASDEQAAFGNPVLAGSGSEESTFNDPVLTSPSVDSIVNDSTCGFYHFRTIWGHLVYDSTENTVTDWTGNLEISRGALVVRRIIRFETGDYILPRTDRRKIEWVSHTSTHNDGLAVDVFVPRPKPILDTTYVVDSLGDTSMVVDTTFPPVDPVTLTFTTPPYSRTFSLAELMKLDTVVDLPDSNQVAFWGMRMYRHVCPRGFLAGSWGPRDTAGIGLIQGRWINQLGNVPGFYEGHYGIDSNGIKLFFGKWIDSTGRFEGFLRGTWGFLPPHDVADTLVIRGWFAGNILDAGRNRVGVLRGKFVRVADTPAGFMEGRWKLICNDEAADNDGGHGGQGRGGDDDGMED